MTHKLLQWVGYGSSVKSVTSPAASPSSVTYLPMGMKSPSFIDGTFLQKHPTKNHLASSLKYFQLIVLFKSIKNSKRRKKGNFTSKYNSNKIKLGEGGRQHCLVLKKITTL